MSYRQLNTYELVFREGDLGDVAYVIESGKIEILKQADHGMVPLAVLPEGEILGETALFEPGCPRSATARALEPCTLRVLSPADFQHMFEACPPALLTIVRKLMARLRVQNARIAAKERAVVLLDAAINHVTVQPGSDAMLGKFEPITVAVTNFPYSIGGHEAGKPRGDQQLSIECLETPILISPHHCNLERHGENVFLADQGSRFGTLVNGHAIGRGKPSFKAPLVPGENRVILGGSQSPYALLLTAA
jgi:CRP-like cAMP-binding protein